MVRKRGTRGRLTDEQLDARYKWIWNYHKQHNRIPNFVEIAEGWGIAKSPIRHTLNRMRDLGWLTMDWHKRRSIKLMRMLD